jgi:hypothetical protein
VFRTKSLESASSASERYFSAEDISNPLKSLSASDSLKKPKKSDSYYSAEQQNISSNATTQYYSLTSDSNTITDNDLNKNADTHSLSSNSFMSAVSSHEDLALVDLRNQMEKPIP